MNQTLRKPIYNNKLTRNKFNKIRSDENWEAYRKSCNLVNKLKKKSLNNYFHERCGGESNDFWNSIEPFFCTKKQYTVVIGTNHLSY